MHAAFIWPSFIILETWMPKPRLCAVVWWDFVLTKITWPGNSGKWLILNLSATQAFFLNIFTYSSSCNLRVVQVLFLTMSLVKLSAPKLPNQLILNVLMILVCSPCRLSVHRHRFVAWYFLDYLLPCIFLCLGHSLPGYHRLHNTLCNYSASDLPFHFHRGNSMRF